MYMRIRCVSQSKGCMAWLNLTDRDGRHIDRCLGVQRAMACPAHNWRLQEGIMDKLTLKFEKYIETDHPVLGDHWIVECPEIQGFVTEGKTIQEALAMAIDCHLRNDIMRGLDERGSQTVVCLELAELLRAM